MTPIRRIRLRAMMRGGSATFALVALAVALAACGSSNSSSSSSSTTSSSTPATSSSTPTTAPVAATGPGVGKPGVTIGDKNFTEENILGQLYAQALGAKGYKVSLKENIGSSEIINKALTSGQIDMYPEYTGVYLSAVAKQTKLPSSAAGAYQQAKAFAETQGATMLEITPFFDTNAFATLPAYASAHNLASIADLKPLGKSVKLGGAPEFATRTEGLIGIEKEYGVKPTFVPITIELSYKALEGGQVNVQNVFTTDGQLLSGKFKVLSDPKHVFGFQNVAPIVKKSVLAAEGTAFAQTLNKVSSLLSIKAIQQMNAAVSIDKQSATSVASQFLKANGLG
jgi:osmoprotectant transport system substrate-binding protein